MDAMALGNIQGGWDACKQVIAGKYEEAGYPEIATFIKAWGFKILDFREKQSNIRSYLYQYKLAKHITATTPLPIIATGAT